MPATAARHTEDRRICLIVAGAGLFGIIASFMLSPAVCLGMMILGVLASVSESIVFNTDGEFSGVGFVAFALVYSFLYALQNPKAFAILGVLR